MQYINERASSLKAVAMVTTAKDAVKIPTEFIYSAREIPLYILNMDICITIRTMVKKNDRVYIQAGGGIVADSVLDNEFQETVNKAGACMTALRMTAEEE